MVVVTNHPSAAKSLENNFDVIFFYPQQLSPGEDPELRKINHNKYPDEVGYRLLKNVIKADDSVNKNTFLVTVLYRDEVRKEKITEYIENCLQIPKDRLNLEHHIRKGVNEIQVAMEG